MAANMYRVGGEYRAQGLRGPGRERLRAGTEKLSPRRRGSERGPEPEPGSEGAGTATRPGAETPRERGAAPTALTGLRLWSPGSGSGAWESGSEGADRQGARRVRATALPLAGEPPGGVLSPGVIVRLGSQRQGPCVSVNNCSLRWDWGTIQSLRWDSRGNPCFLLIKAHF